MAKKEVQEVQEAPQEVQEAPQEVQEAPQVKIKIKPDRCCGDLSIADGRGNARNFSLYVVYTVSKEFFDGLKNEYKELLEVVE